MHFLAVTTSVTIRNLVTDICVWSFKSPLLILRRALLDLAVGRRDRRKLKISPGLDTALLQLHSVITSSAISRLVNFPWLTVTDGSVAENALVQLHKQMELTSWSIPQPQSPHSEKCILIWTNEDKSLRCSTYSYDKWLGRVSLQKQKRNIHIQRIHVLSLAREQRLHCLTAEHSCYVTRHERCCWKA